MARTHPDRCPTCGQPKPKPKPKGLIEFNRPVNEAEAEESKRRFLEAQDVGPSAYRVVTEPRSGDKWGIWPLVLGLLALAAAGIVAVLGWAP